MTLVWTAAALLETGYAILAILGDLQAHLWTFLSVYAILALVVFLTVRRIAREETANRRLAIPLVLGAIAFRATLWPVLPQLSTDLYRYAWEGKVQRAGFSPYEYPPLAPELSSLRDGLYASITHKEVPTVYPPLTQGVFRLGSWLGDRWHHPLIVQKLLFAGCDLFSLAVLWIWLRMRGRGLAAWTVYAWNPLVILECAGAGHNDALGILTLMIALALLDARRDILSGIVFGVSFLSKYLAILFIPWLLWRKRWSCAAGAVIVGALGMIPFCACWLMSQGAKEYAARWQFNGSIYPVLLSFLRHPAWTKWTVAAVLLATCIEAARRVTDITRYAIIVIATALLLAPTVHPWYFLWVIPFVALIPSIGLLLWNATIVLSYTALRRWALYHVWDLHPAVQCAEYLPVFAGLLWDWRRRKVS